MAQLQQHWTHGFEAPNFAHNAHLKLPTPKPATTIHLPTPTLLDLLNPTPADETFMFNHPDPYGAHEMLGEDEEDKETDNGEVAPTAASNIPPPFAAFVPTVPHITRGARRLQIESLIDLSNARLLARYTPKAEQTSSEHTTKVPIQKTSGKPMEWVKETWSMSDITF